MKIETRELKQWVTLAPGDTGRMNRVGTSNQAVYVGKISKVKLLDIETKEKKYCSNMLLEQDNFVRFVAKGTT
jgi:hypothetical protein